MTYRVVIQPFARAEAHETYEWLRGQTVQSADRWFEGLLDAIETLRTFPARCPLARENDAFDEEVRHLLYGRGRNVYRIVFIIRGEAVHIISIRHGARRPLRVGEWIDDDDDGTP